MSGQNQQEVVVEAENYDEALAKALKILGTTKKKVSVEVISTQKPGLLGFGKKSVILRVTPIPDLTQLVDEILGVDEKPAGRTENSQPRVEYSAEAVEATDGSVTIKDGVVLVTDPQLGGRFPVLTPNENTIITVNDVRIYEPTVVSSEDRIWVGTVQYKPEQKVEIEVSEDKLTAYLKIQRFPGREYIIEDCPPTPELKPRPRLVKAVPPDPVLRKDIETIVHMSGIMYGLDLSGIDAAIDDVDSAETKIIIARGKPPVDARDGKIILKFDQGSPMRGINPYGEGLVNSVEVGTVLALKTPPVRGEAGMDIYGTPIPPREAVDVELLAKDGVQIVQNGRAAVALIAGRTVVEGKDNNIFRVIPVHTVHGDVNISVGNLKFKGDIHIFGSVLDGFRVEAGGNIKVYGSVIHAGLLAGGSVEVGKNIISSKVKTGGQAVLYKLTEPLFKEIRNKLEQLQGTVQQLKKHPSFSVADLNDGDGRLIHLLINSRYQVLTKIAAKLKELIYGDELLHDSFRRVVETLYNKLHGLGPLRIKESKELELLVQSIDEVFQEIEDLSATPADVHAAYVQNSWVQASGDIVISGAGSIISNLTAGRNIIINNDHGVVRGGQLTANGLIKLKEVGSSSEAAVTINLIGKSKLEADFIHPIVIVEHGAQKYRFETWPARYVEAFANKEGKLVVNKLTSKGSEGL